MRQSACGFWPARVGGAENAMGGTPTGLVLTKSSRRGSGRESTRGAGASIQLNHEWTVMNPDFQSEPIPSVRNDGGRM